MKIIKLEEIKNLSNDELFNYFKNVVVIPTETVYGLAARIDNEEALKNIYKIKGRPSDNPLIVHVSSYEMLVNYIEGEVPVEYRKLIDKFWPGPLSLLFKAKNTISKVVRGNMETSVVIRMPKNKDLRNLIERLGVPLAAPSANKSGKPSPTEISHILDDLKNEVDIFIDDGRCTKGLESTIFGIVDSKYVLLRPGSITKEQIEEVLETQIEVKIKADLKDKILCPGQKYKHYSPNHPLYIFKGDSWFINMENERLNNEKKIVGLLKRGDINLNIDNYIVYDLGSDLETCAINLFDGIINLDKKCDIIFVKEFEENDLGLAIMDRLNKAATKII